MAIVDRCRRRGVQWYFLPMDMEQTSLRITQTHGYCLTAIINLLKGRGKSMKKFLTFGFFFNIVILCTLSSSLYWFVAMGPTDGILVPSIFLLYIGSFYTRRYRYIGSESFKRSMKMKNVPFFGKLGTLMSEKASQFMYLEIGIILTISGGALLIKAFM